MAAQPHSPMTQAEFLTWEVEQEEKHEFVDGYIYPLFGDRTIKGFAGGRLRHALMATELIVSIAPAARPCRTAGSDVRVETVTSTRYPDVLVTCDERDSNDALVVRHPKLIVEVLSESTARDDLGPKMREYKTIDALEEYLMIDSRKRWAQVLRRAPGGWTLDAAVTAGRLDLSSIGVRIDLDELYNLVGIPS